MTPVIAWSEAPWQSGGMLRSLRLLLVFSTLVATAAAATGDRWPLAEAPAPLKPAAARATEGFQSLAKTLQGRLQKALADGGPVEAISVCRVEAPKLTAGVSREKGLLLGRTSTRLRNPANAPRAWVQPYLAAWGDRPAAEAPVEVVDLGEGRVGVIGPIPAGPLCLTCHGDPKAMSTGLRDALRRSYPQDRATGFSAGDLRGVFWAEVPQVR